MIKKWVVDRIELELDEEAPSARIVIYSGERMFTLEYVDTQIDDSPYARQLNVVEITDLSPTEHIPLK